MTTISAIIITKNAGNYLDACLMSLNGLVDEIIVVDFESHDNTLEIAQKHHAVICQTPDWPGFGVQKNRALDLAKNQWVLSIDSDEIVTPELKEEITAIINNPGDTKIFAVPRKNIFCGKTIHHGDWYPDYQNRLFVNGCTRFTNDKVHETLIINKIKVKKLKSHLLHYSNNSFLQHIHKTILYANLGATVGYEKNKAASPFKAITHGIWAFIKSYVIKRGFLDGFYGFHIALHIALGSYYKYLFIVELNKTKGVKNKTETLANN